MNKDDIEAKLKSIISDVDEPVVKTEDEGLKAKREKFIDDLKTLTKTDRKINDEYKELELKKKEYSAPTDNEIEKLAEAAVALKYDGQKEILGDKSEAAAKELEDKKIKAVESNENNKIALNAAYDDAKEELSRQAIRRGIARSSIILDRLSKLDADRIKDIFALDEKSHKEISDIDGEINKVESEYKSAVKGLDVNMAIEKSEKIDELKKEREKKLEEMLEYNNGIDEKLVKFYNSTVDLRRAAENVKADDEVLKERYLQALKYYYSLTPDVALKEFESDYEVKSLLGDKYSDMVKKYLENWNSAVKR